MDEIFLSEQKKEMTAKIRQIQIPKFMITRKSDNRKTGDSPKTSMLNNLILIGLAAFVYFIPMYDTHFNIALIGNVASGLFTAGIALGAYIRGREYEMD